MTDVKKTTDTSNIWTGILPYWAGTDEAEQAILVTLPEKVIYSDYVDDYVYRMVVPVDLSSSFEAQPAEEQQAGHAICLVDANELKDDIYSSGYSFEMTPLEKSLGYFVADNKLTQDYLNEFLAEYLKEVSFFGMGFPEREERIAELHRDLEKAQEDIKAGRTIPADEVFGKPPTMRCMSASFWNFPRS